MKTSKQRLVNLGIVLSVAVNLVMLGELGYLASIDHQNNGIYSSLNSPVVIYLPKAVDTSSIKTSIKLPAAQ